MGNQVSNERDDFAVINNSSSRSSPNSKSVSEDVRSAEARLLDDLVDRTV